MIGMCKNCVEITVTSYNQTGNARRCSVHARLAVRCLIASHVCWHVRRIPPFAVRYTGHLLELARALVILRKALAVDHQGHISGEAHPRLVVEMLVEVKVRTSQVT